MRGTSSPSQAFSAHWSCARERVRLLAAGCCASCRRRRYVQRGWRTLSTPETCRRASICGTCRSGCHGPRCDGRRSRLGAVKCSRPLQRRLGANVPTPITPTSTCRPATSARSKPTPRRPRAWPARPLPGPSFVEPAQPLGRRDRCRLRQSRRRRPSTRRVRSGAANASKRSPRPLSQAMGLWRALAEALHRLDTISFVLIGLLTNCSNACLHTLSNGYA